MNKNLIFQYNKGKIAVLGSVHVFSDQYVEKEENGKILDVIISFLTTDDIKLNQIDAEDPEVRFTKLLAKLEEGCHNYYTYDLDRKVN